MHSPIMMEGNQMILSQAKYFLDFSCYLTLNTISNIFSLKKLNTGVYVPQNCVRFWRQRKQGQKVRCQNLSSTSALTVWHCFTHLKPGWSIGEPTAGAARTVIQIP